MIFFFVEKIRMKKILTYVLCLFCVCGLLCAQDDKESDKEKKNMSESRREVGLLQEGESLDLEVDFEEEGTPMLPLPIVNPLGTRQRLNKAQGFSNSALRIIAGITTVVMTKALMSDESLPSIPIPGSGPVLALGLFVAMDAFAISYALTRRTEPKRYLTEKGGGAFYLGVGLEAMEKVCGALPPTLLAIATTAGFDQLLQFALDHQDDYPNLVLGLFYLMTPLFDTLQNAAMWLPIYALGQYIVKVVYEKVTHTVSPEYIPDEFPQTAWYQNWSQLLVRTSFALTLSETIRQVLNTIGPARELHHRRWLFYGAMAEGMLHAVRSVSEVPRPFRNMQYFWEQHPPREQVYVLVGPEFAPEPVYQPVAASVYKQGISISAKLAVVCAAFGVAVLAEEMVMKVLGGQDEEFKDPAQWSTGGRIGTTIAIDALVIGGCYFMEEGIKRLPHLYRWCKNRLFNRQAERPEEMVEMVTLHQN